MSGKEPAPPGAAPSAPAAHEEHAERLQEAERLMQEGRYAEALALFEQAGNPARTNQAREAYAQFLANQGRFGDAYEQLRRALQRRSG